MYCFCKIQNHEPKSRTTLSWFSYNDNYYVPSTVGIQYFLQYIHSFFTYKIAIYSDCYSRANNENFNFSDAVKDEEIENWAAIKIQHSFKQYKNHKTLSQDLKDSPQWKNDDVLATLLPNRWSGLGKWQYKVQKTMPIINNSRKESSKLLKEKFHPLFRPQMSNPVSLWLSKYFKQALHSLSAATPPYHLLFTHPWPSHLTMMHCSIYVNSEIVEYSDIVNYYHSLLLSFQC